MIPNRRSSLAVAICCVSNNSKCRDSAEALQWGSSTLRHATMFFHVYATENSALVSAALRVGQASDWNADTATYVFSS